MDSKVGNLQGARTVLVKVVESGLTDADHLGMAGCGNKQIGSVEQLLLRLVRMNADGAPDVGKAFGDFAHARKAVHARADADANADSGVSRSRYHRLQLGREFGEIEVTMRVDEHQSAPARRVA